MVVKVTASVPHALNTKRTNAPTILSPRMHPEKVFWRNVQSQSQFLHHLLFHVFPDRPPAHPPARFAEYSFAIVQVHPRNEGSGVFCCPDDDRAPKSNRVSRFFSSLCCGPDDSEFPRHHPGQRRSYARQESRPHRQLHFQAHQLRQRRGQLGGQLVEVREGGRVAARRCEHSPNSSSSIRPFNSPRWPVSSKLAPSINPPIHSYPFLSIPLMSLSHPRVPSPQPRLYIPRNK